MSLQQKLFDIFDIFIPEGTSNKTAIKELNRRGKVDLKKITDIVFLLVEEIEELKSKQKKS